MRQNLRLQRPFRLASFDDGSKWIPHIRGVYPKSKLSSLGRMFLVRWAPAGREGNLL